MKRRNVSLESHQVELEAQISGLDLGELVFEVVVAGIQGVQCCRVSLRRKVVSLRILACVGLTHLY